MKLTPKCSNTKAIPHLYKLKKKLDINGVSNKKLCLWEQTIPVWQGQNKGKSPEMTSKQVCSVKDWQFVNTWGSSVSYIYLGKK